MIWSQSGFFKLKLERNRRSYKFLLYQIILFALIKLQMTEGTKCSCEHFLGVHAVPIIPKYTVPCQLQMLLLLLPLLLYVSSVTHANVNGSWCDRKSIEKVVELSGSAVRSSSI